MSNFEPYQNPRQSRLEQWRGDITKMRSLGWPYPAIAKWVFDTHQISISTEAIRQFCKLRGIHKGLKTSPASSNRKRHRKKKSTEAPAQEKEEVFKFEPKPIDVHRR